MQDSVRILARAFRVHQANATAVAALDLVTAAQKGLPAVALTAPTNGAALDACPNTYLAAFPGAGGERGLPEAHAVKARRVGGCRVGQDLEAAVAVAAHCA
jgi:hypothetical protein